MRIRHLLFIFVLAAISFRCEAQPSPNRLEIVSPTIQQEATSVWQTIHDIAFFEKQGYTIHLPEDPIIDELIVKSKNGAFGDDDFATIYRLLETKIFDPNNYQPAIQHVERQADLINRLILELETASGSWNWNFQLFDTYKVVFTLYGTGGSYDPDNGTITLWTNETGGFKKYRNPANTIIHEIVHLGIEASIVQQYTLSHRRKERVVDTMVSLLFSEDLPEYRIQDMGDDDIDLHLKTLVEIGSLPAILTKLKE